MLVSEIVNTSLPSLNINDRVSFALDLMDDYDVLELPVVSEKKYLGIISKDELTDAETPEMKIASLGHLQGFAIRIDEHFLTALQLISQNELSLLPVINHQQELEGVILLKELARTITQFTGAAERGAVIVLEIEKRNFSFGELSRLIETNDAYITQLNTYTEPATGLMIVTIKINKVEVSSIIATLQRYEYTVRYYFGREDYANELKENYDHLMSYLNM